MINTIPDPNPSLLTHSSCSEHSLYVATIFCDKLSTQHHVKK